MIKTKVGTCKTVQKNNRNRKKARERDHVICYSEIFFFFDLSSGWNNFGCPHSFFLLNLILSPLHLQPQLV